MNRKQRDAVIAVILRGAVDAIDRAYEDDEGIEGLTYREAIKEASRLLGRLPGRVWHKGLPDPDAKP